MQKALIAGVLTALSLVNSARAELPQPWELGAEAYQQTGNYLAPLLALETQMEAYSATPNYPWALEYLGFSQSYVGDYAAALRSFDRKEAAQDWAEDQQTIEAVPEPALETLVKAADQHQAIFINEAHHRPQHRALTLQLLEKLYAKGFRYFAAETLAPDPDLAKRGYPIRIKTGYYTDEPIYGELVRTALRLGYKVISYEAVERCEPKADDPAYCAHEREKIQARHLHERIFKADPKAKLLLHAGYGHIDEKGTANFIPMAVHFKKLTGIDPLSLDQTEMSEHSDPRFESPFYAKALKSHKLTQPTLLHEPDGSYWSGWYEGHYDGLIVSPRSVTVQGRPDWLLMNGLRHFSPIQPEICQGKFPCLVQAFVKGEGPDAVPADQILLRQPSATALALRPGHYELIVLDAEGVILTRSSLKSSGP